MQADSSYITRLRGSSLHHDGKGGCHMYIEFAPFGSLSDLVKHYAKEKEVNIPEIFIRLVFRNLIRACRVVEDRLWIIQ
jgi:hypothetical protein